MSPYRSSPLTPRHAGQRRLRRFAYLSYVLNAVTCWLLSGLNIAQRNWLSAALFAVAALGNTYSAWLWIRRGREMAALYWWAGRKENDDHVGE